MAAIATRRNVLLLSLLLALFTSMLVYKFLQEQKRQSQTVKVPVVVANIDIPARQIVGRNDVSVVLIPNEQVRGQVCARAEEVVGKVAMKNIVRKAMVSPVDVGDPTIKLGLSYVIPANMRAITVGIDDVSGVAGFLKPRDHVDIVGAFESDGTATARTVLQDIELVALGTEVEQEKVSQDSGKARSTQRTTATLLVTPEDAEKLVLADNQGRLRLLLRSPGDLVRVPSKGARTIQVTGIAPKQESAPKVVETSAPVKPSAPIWNPPSEKPRTWVTPAPLIKAEPVQEPKKEIEVIRGNKTEKIEVEDQSSSLPDDLQNVTPKNTKEVAGTGPYTVWLASGQ